MEQDADASCTTPSTGSACSIWARELEALAATLPADKADEAAPRPSLCDESMRRRCHGAGKLRTLPMAPPTVEEH